MGTVDGRPAVLPARASSAASRRSRPACCSPSGRRTCTSRRFAREDIYIACDHARAARRHVPLPRPAAPPPPGADRRAARAQLRHQGVDVHHGLRGRDVLPSRSLVAVAPRGGCATRRSCARCASVGWEAWGWALAAFVGVYTILFTTFLTHPKGVYGPLRPASTTGSASTASGAAASRTYFYVVVLFGEEWPVLLLGAIGAVVALRRPTLLRVFLIWAFVLSLAVYSWAGEKFAWLVHAPAAAADAARRASACRRSGRRAASWYGKLGPRRRGRRARLRRVRLAARSTRSTAPTRASCSSPRSPPRRSRRSRDEVVAQGRSASDRPCTVTVDAADGATFPWAWYFRHLHVGYVDLSTQGTAAATRTR